ncbi:spermine oxidase-like [Drosophila sulfurigaster albostrigata]|uniref:spermine oxidase-like n=1 Tax=Drosophila sulfurigaster albostrigata TaxID=89887 RepID=UPI002D21C180|nr:spermine oxidase-like [Drosophila sulfurigaster albostrigata]
MFRLLNLAKISGDKRNIIKTKSALSSHQSPTSRGIVIKSTSRTLEIMSNKTKQTARIVVIGSGPSGIAAATRLIEQGFKNVSILEAENRIGGRICTVPFGDSVVDKGAQWCHGESGNVVYNRVKDLNLLHRTGDALKTMTLVRSNKQVLNNETAFILGSAFESSLPTTPNELNGSLGDHLTDNFWKALSASPPVDKTIAKELFETGKRLRCSFTASDHLFEVSRRAHLEFAQSDGEFLLNWKDKGYKSFLKVLMNAKLNDAEDLGVLNGRVRLSKRLTEINYASDEQLKLRCEDGEVITADHVICTVSLGVLKAVHQQLFVPALPEAKVRAIKGLRIGTVNKFYLEFAEQPLPADWIGANFLWLEEDLDELRGTERFWLEGVFGFHRVLHQPRLLQGWIIGEHARYMETLTEEEVIEGLLWFFRKFLPFNVPHPQRFLRTQWTSNPNFRGSYSSRTNYTDELRTGPWDLATPLLDATGRPKVQFAGEATSKTHFSTVHGATETGWREADRLNEYYSSRNKL